MLELTIIVLLILFCILFVEIQAYIKDRKSYRFIWIISFSLLISWGLSIIINHRY